MARHGDALVLRGSTWYLDFRHNGVRYQRRLGRHITRQVARELATVQRAAILRGESGIGPKKRKDIDFEKAKEQFLAWVETNKRPRTMRGYRQCLVHLSHSFQGKRLSQISAFDVERHKKRRVEAHARVRANREIACLKTLINRCKDWGFYEGANPATAVKKLEEPQRRLRYLEPDEEGRLLAAAPELLRSLIVVAVNTGLRIGAEALTLRWPDVDLDRGTLTVLAAYAKNKRTRTVNLNSRAIEALTALKAAARSEYVFSKRTGQPYGSMEKPFAKACARAGLAGSGVTLHTLRHTFASRLVMAGVDLRTVQELAGWADLSMVQRYAHVSQEHKARAVERIAAEFPYAIPYTPSQAAIVPLAKLHASM